MSAGAGVSGISYNLLITRSYCGIELAISRASKEENKQYFKKLYKEKEAIEKSFGGTLIWEEMPDKKMSRIITKLEDVNLFDDTDWEQMNKFIITYLPKI